MRLHPPRRSETELRCQELAKAIIGLEQAAIREPETVEARATLAIDIEVMRRCLTTTQAIIEVAHIQLRKAEDMLTSSRNNYLGS
jgi:7,8-dihydro-6-hydroxymethylpterin-pyrophosphokinase